MTDELIQQQIPQQRGNYAVPGFLTGAAIGGGLGVAGAHYKNWGITQKPDLDKVFAQEPDSFSSQIEKAEGDNKSFLEAAKEETQKIKDAGSEFEKYESELKTNGKTTTVELTDELKNKRKLAQDARDAEFKRIFEQEKAKIKVPTDTAPKRAHQWTKITVNPNDFAIPAGASEEEIKEINGRLYDTLRQKGIRGNNKGSLAQQYRTAYQAVMDARADVDAQLANIKANRNVSVIAYDTALARLIDPAITPTTLENLTPTQFHDLLNKTEDVGGGVFRRIFRKDKLAELARQMAEDELPELNSSATSFEESVLKQLGATEGAAPKGSGWRTFTVERVRPNGEAYDVVYHMNRSQFESAVKKYNKSDNLGKLRKELAGKIVGGFRQRVAVAQANRNAGLNVINKITELPREQIQVLESEGLIRRGTNGRINWFDLPTVRTWTNDQFAADMNSRNADTQRIARAKNALRKAYSREMQIVDRNLLNAYSGIQEFEAFDRQIAEAYTTNERLTRANQAFEERFKATLKNGETLIEGTSNAVASDVEAQARAAAEKALEGSKVANDLAAVEKEIAEFTEKNGKKTEYTAEELAAALKEKFGASTKSDYEKAVKEKAQERLKGLAEKAKFANKTLTGLAAAGTLALLGGIIGMATKDNA